MAENTDKFKKGARRFTTTIGTGGVPDDTTTTIPLDSTAGLATDTAVEVTIDRVDSSGDLTLANEEVVTGVVSGNNLITCTRGDEGTAQAHAVGAIVEARLTADQWNDMIGGILVEHNQDGTHSATDGWTASPYEFTYHSPTEIKLAGSVWNNDVFLKGAKVKLTNDGSVKTFYVVSMISFGLDTLMTIAGEEDLVSSAITLPFYSYADCPQGFKKGEDWYKCKVYLSADQLIPTNTITKISFDTEVYDINSDFNITTYEWTCPLTADYLVESSNSFITNVTGDRTGFIYSNTSTIIARLSRVSANTESTTTINTSPIFHIEKGDVIHFTAYQTSGGALDLLGATEDLTHASIQFVGL